MANAIEPVSQIQEATDQPEPESSPSIATPEAERRRFLVGSAAAVASTAIAGCATANGGAGGASGTIVGTEHWAVKRTAQGPVRLFMWRKHIPGQAAKGTVVFVHGSSVQSVPAFDLQVPGQPHFSTMDTFVRMGFDTWCFDCEGYGRSDKHRDMNADIAAGADDAAIVVEEITRITGRDKVLMYGSSSGALRAALYAQRHPARVKRLALDAFVWTGEGSPTLNERKKRLAQYRASNRRPIDRAFVRSIFTRDVEGVADPAMVEAFADAVLAMDNSMPTGTYVDMSANLPVCDPEKITVPTLIMRGQWDGIATIEDLNKFFMKLPNPDKQFIVMPGIAHTSIRSRNFALVYHLLTAFLSQPDPVYSGKAHA